MENFGNIYGLIKEMISEFPSTYQVYQIAKKDRSIALEDPS
jgi:hypothetical protein